MSEPGQLDDRAAVSTGSSLHEPVTGIKGVGSALAERLGRLGIRRQLDLLFHLPLRYEDRTRLTPIGSVRPGDTVVIEGAILAADVVFGRRRSLLCRVRDGTGTLSLRLFHFTRRQREALVAGRTLRAYGEVRSGATGPELFHPEYQVLTASPPPLPDRLTPVYPVTEGLSQRRIRELCRHGLARARALGNVLETELLDALDALHGPDPTVSLAQLQAGAHPAQRRLALDELMAHHLSLLRARRRSRERTAPALRPNDRLVGPFLARLPFSLTGAQRRVIGEIDADLAGRHPSLRLIQGDVGSGKTVVAAVAGLRAVENGRQAALMAPTELLAEQHGRTLEAWLRPLGIEVVLLTGRTRASERRRAEAAIADGGAGVVVGTHALFQAGVAFHDLGLVIVDEQHRFGVHQRLSLRQKGARDERVPHQLVMTATPIPRTLAMTAYADLALSVLDELPPGRSPVTTVAVEAQRREEVVERVAAACRAGRQAYWVCTLVEESEALQAEAAEQTATLLREALPELGVGLVHGRMKAEEKAATMSAFEGGEIDLLVATTVIEVGVDVPNASLMVIENPERLGLAQLHQLRGRVGRGAVASHCVLLYRAPLSRAGRERLAILRESDDGFVIAEKDLALRGPGEVLGTRQTGLADLRVADLQRDRDLLDEVERRAAELLARDPAAADRVVERWLGGRERYAEA